MNDEKIWIELIRNQEISSIKKYLIDSKVEKILEIGGNNGFLAKILADWGFEVTSIDINPSPTYFDVKKMDAINLEFSPNTFDLVFSSHVIAHIKEKKLLFDQINKILKDDGFIIHIVPSNWWSLITNFWHYILIFSLISHYFMFRQIVLSFVSSISIPISFNSLRILSARLKFLLPLASLRSFINFSMV